MDKIYSRRRIKLPKFIINEKFLKKLIILIIIIAVIICTIKRIYGNVKPMFESLCTLKATNIANKLINEGAKQSLDNMGYDDFITVIQDENGKVVVVKSNIINMNKVATDVTLSTQDKLNEMGVTEVFIPSGSLLGLNILYNIGIKIPIQVKPSGIATTDFITEFKSCGINQTLHRIYLNCKSRVNIVTPFKTITSEIETQVLIAETVIVGDIPESYYNLEGMKEESAVDIIN